MLKWLLLSCVVKQMQLSLQVFKAKDISEYEVSHVAVKSQLWHFSTCTALACRPSTETTKCSCCKVCSRSLQLSLKARVPQVVKTIILIVGLGGGGKDYIDLETEFCHCLVYKADPFELSPVCGTKCPCVYLSCCSSMTDLLLSLGKCLLSSKSTSRCPFLFSFIS